MAHHMNGPVSFLTHFLYLDVDGRVESLGSAFSGAARVLDGVWRESVFMADTTNAPSCTDCISGGQSSNGLLASTGLGRAPQASLHPLGLS